MRRRTRALILGAMIGAFLAPGLAAVAPHALSKLGVKSEPVLSTAAVSIAIGTPVVCALGLARTVRSSDEQDNRSA